MLGIQIQIRCSSFCLVFTYRFCVFNWRIIAFQCCVGFFCATTWISSKYTSILEKEMAAHFSTLAWKIPWMEEAGRLQSMGSQRVGHDWATSLSLSYIYSLPLESPTHPPHSTSRGCLSTELVRGSSSSFNFCNLHGPSPSPIPSAPPHPHPRCPPLSCLLIPHVSV